MEGKFKATKKTKLNIKYRGLPVIKTYYQGKYTRDEIRNFTQKFSNKMKERGLNGFIGVPLYTDDGWRGGHLTEFGDDIRLYTIIDSPDMEGSDQKYYYNFAITFFQYNPPTNGGANSKYNDCLWIALRKIITDDVVFRHSYTGKNPLETPKHFKRYLEINRTDKIDISLIPVIEQIPQLKDYKINVTGDHIYTSPKECRYEINILLKDGHYTYNKQAQGYKTKTFFEEKVPVLYRYNKTNQSVVIYDGKETKVVNRTLIPKLVDDYKSGFIYVKADDFLFKREKSKVLIDGKVVYEKEKEKPLDELYPIFIQYTEELKKHSNGKINLYKTGSIYNTALDLFNRFTKSIVPEEILEDEAEWIDKCSTGALIWSQIYEGEGFKYDFTSMYPSILIDSRFMVPYKRGEFKILTTLPETWQNGIYRCKITTDDTNAWKLFRFNKLNYYTHIDILRAQGLGYDINLIQDNKPNSLIYSKDKLINSSRFFKEYIDLLYSLKEKKVPLAKELLNILWGILCERKIKKQKTGQKEINITGNEKIYQICPLDGNEEHDLVATYVPEHYFKYDFARLKPFILSKGRFKFSKFMEPFVDDIVRAHTDGIIATKKLVSNDIQEGKLGKVKFEGYAKHCDIKNCIHYVFE
jgi:hypothetical protein